MLLVEYKSTANEITCVQPLLNVCTLYSGLRQKQEVITPPSYVRFGVTIKLMKELLLTPP